jgi:hypothetical protein
VRLGVFVGTVVAVANGAGLRIITDLVGVAMVAGLWPQAAAAQARAKKIRMNTRLHLGMITSQAAE